MSSTEPDDSTPVSDKAASSSTSPSTGRYGVNMQFFGRLRWVLRALFPRVGSFSALLFLLLIMFCSAEQYVVYWMGIIPSKYFRVLGDKDLEAFQWLTAESLGLVIIVAIVKSSRTYVSSVLYVVWRELLSRDLQDRYFSGITYYRLNVLQTSVDNPDQRLTQDVNKLCRTLSSLTSAVIISPCIIAYYTYSVYVNTGYVGVVSIYGFFVLATAVNRLFMSPIVAHVVKQEQREGDFRFKHMQIRVHSEPLAFHGSASSELLACNWRLQLLINTQLQLAARRLALGVAVNTVDYLGSIVNYMVIAVPIYSGWYDDVTPQELSSKISQNSFVCMYLIYNFTQLVNLSSDVADLAGVTHRVGELYEAFQVNTDCSKSDTGPDSPDSPDTDLTDSRSVFSGPDSSQVHATAENCGGFEDADVMLDVAVHTTDDSSNTCDWDTPYSLVGVGVAVPGGSQLLIRDVTLSVRRHRWLLVRGPSSCGKTALLRVLRALWTPVGGQLTRRVRAGAGHVFYMPQRPFFTDGSLRQQIVYPDRLSERTDCDSVTSRILADLGRVKLHNLPQRCGGLDATPLSNWYDMLSPGEMQRLCFVRVLYHRPWFVFLDEATSAVEPDMEMIIYQECRRLGTTVISVAHGDSLLKFHDWLLELTSDGGWSLQPIHQGGSQPIQDAGSQPIHQGGSQPIQDGGSQPIQDGGSQPIQDGGSQPIHQGGSQPIQDGGSQPIQDGGSQPIQDGGSQPIQDGGSQPIHQGGSQPIHDAGSQPIIDCGSQPIHNEGTQLHC